MKCCAFPLFLGFLFVCGNCAFPPDYCDTYINITEPWRNSGFTSTSFLGFPKNDSHLAGNWWRFVGIGGDRIVTGCIHGPCGGTQNPIYLYIGFTHPSTESKIPSTTTAYTETGVCVQYGVVMDVVLCPGGFYIYRPKSYLYHDSAYVTIHYQCNLDSCGPLAECTVGGACSCVAGYIMQQDKLPTADSYPCVDIDECQKTPGVCVVNSKCINTAGSFFCKCLDGYNTTNPELPPGVSNPCTDIDECLENICGENGDCINQIGSYSCDCHKGYYNASDVVPVCQDINECNEPGVCGELTLCMNAPGGFYCSCSDGFFPSTGVVWTIGVTFCKDLQLILDEITPPQGQTKERAFLINLDEQLKKNEGIVLAEEIVANGFSVSMEVAGVGPRASSTQVGSEGDRETGNLIQSISDRLVSAMVEPGQNQTKKTLKTPTVDLVLETITTGSNTSESFDLLSKNNTMEINLEGLVKTNNDSVLVHCGKEGTELQGEALCLLVSLHSYPQVWSQTWSSDQNNEIAGSASVAFMTLTGMELLLSHQYFETENRTEMLSDVISAFLPSMNNTNLTEPVNFTMRHKKTLPESGLVTCVYWVDQTEEDKLGRENMKTTGWSVEGCWVASTNENYTVCSCSHLSTFALILQIGEPPPDSSFLELLNIICVVAGLFFFALAVLTFLLCSWNPKINNTARLHLCLSLGLTQFLLLWNEKYAENQLACAVMAGILHFLVVASFVWMLLEALQLYMLVQKLTKVQVIEKDGLPKPLLYVIGYGVPLVIVSISAAVYSAGYGATDDKVCWLSDERNFKWALTGPVIIVLALNCILFGATLWSLRPTLASMRSDISQSKDTKLIMFKILAQFVILGCTWILGLFQSSLFLQILFIVLNSQQGTFLYIVHCLLNEEVRNEYRKWLLCSSNKTREGSVKDVSVSEDFEKTDAPSG